MKTILLLSLAALLPALENNPYLTKHDTTTHIVAGTLIGATAAYAVREAGAPAWASYATAFLLPCALGQAKERWHDQNYSGKDANSWVIAGVGAVGITAAFEVRF